MLAVDGVSFDLARGEILALVGESGCGKTSIAHAVMRLVPTSGGSIVFRGQDITALSDRTMRPIRAGIQMVFQDPYESLDPRQTVFDLVAEPLTIHGRATDRRGTATRGAGRADRCRAASGGRDRATSSAPPVGRTAAARGGRGHDGARSGRHRGRRADVDARRVAPRRDPAPDAGPARAAPGLVPVHHARPLARVGRRRSHRGGVSRPDRGDRSVRRGHRAPQAPVHESAGLGDPGAGGRRRRRSDRAGRRDAVGAQRPARLPLPSSMLALRGARPARGVHDDRSARRQRSGGGPHEVACHFPLDEPAQGGTTR